MTEYSQETRIVIGQNVERIRKRLGISAPDFAKAIGVERAYVYKIQNADANFTIDLLGRMAGALGVRPATLLRSEVPVAAVE